MALRRLCPSLKSSMVVTYYIFRRATTELNLSNLPLPPWKFSIDRKDPVLVVDDQEIMSNLATRMLTRLGFENVDHSVDGYQALALLRERKHKLVISDLHMEAMGGLQLLKAIRADAHLKNTPFILMTGSVDVPNVVAAKLAGTDAYLLKPFTSDQLKAKLHEVLS
jgi:two-component system, chemotaxis family, chemotaxis protein CheY